MPLIFNEDFSFTLSLFKRNHELFIAVSITVTSEHLHFAWKPLILLLLIWKDDWNNRNKVKTSDLLCLWGNRILNFYGLEVLLKFKFSFTFDLRLVSFRDLLSLRNFPGCFSPLPHPHWIYVNPLTPRRKFVKSTCPHGGAVSQGFREKWLRFATQAG